MLCFFFFKQKTAYEMRISDWSSDVCSSDLFAGSIASAAKPGPGHRPAIPQPVPNSAAPPIRRGVRSVRSGRANVAPIKGFAIRAWTRQARSEEHTSELQSLMRTSYAVFCLKKKNTLTSNWISQTTISARQWDNERYNYRMTRNLN